MTMKQTAKPIKLFIIIIATSLTGIITLVSADRKVGAAKLNDKATDQVADARNPKQEIRPTVDPGHPDSAKAYYQQLSTDLKFLTPATILTSNIDAVLSYLGYGGLHAIDLDKLESGILMNFDSLKSAVSDKAAFNTIFPTSQDLPAGNILVTRFFSPKITDDSHLPPHAYGWRKTIRLLTNPKTATTDAKKNISEVFILYNYFQSDLSKSPFDLGNQPVNIQMALVSTSSAVLSGHTSLYWLDYDEDYKLFDHLDAFFDARDPILPKKSYYVPNACNACHGNAKKPLLNYLDTDHWIDRAMNKDFSTFTDSKWPIFFDAGTRDESSPKYASAFAIVKQLNQEMADQNASTSKTAFQTAASKNWMTLHNNSIKYLEPIDRIIPIPPSSKKWIKGNAEDEKILSLLNQYCFRCHGSVSFNVFDRGMLDQNALALKMRARLLFNPAEHPTEDSRTAMPPDRVMNEADKQALIDYCNKILN